MISADNRPSLRIKQTIKRSKVSSEYSNIPQIGLIPVPAAYEKQNFGTLSEFLSNQPLHFGLPHKKKKVITQQVDSNRAESTAINSQLRFAHKAVIQGIFSSIYGHEVQALYNAEMTKVKRNKSFKTINLERLSAVLNKFQQNNRNQSLLASHQKKIVSNANSQKHKHKAVLIQDYQEQKEKKFFQLKQKYPRLRNLDLTSKIAKKNDFSTSFLTQNFHNIESEQNDCYLFQDKSELAIEMQPQFSVAKWVQILASCKYQHLKTIKLHMIRVEQEILMLALDCIHFLVEDEIEQLSISNIAIENVDTFTEKIKAVLIAIPIKRIKLECLDIGTRQASQIINGLIQNKVVEQVSLRGNHIDCLIMRSLQKLVRKCQSITVIDMRQNDIKADLRDKNKKIQFV